MQATHRRFAAFLIAFAAPGAAAAQQDRLERVERLVGDYRGLDGIGQVVVEEGHGTGVMVSPCHVITNHHVAFGTEGRAADPARRFLFQVGQTAASHRHAFRTVHELEPLVAGDYQRHRRAAMAIERERRERGLAQDDPEWRRLFAAFRRELIKGVGEDWALLRIKGGARSPHPFVRPARNVNFSDLGDREVGIAGFPGYRGDRDGFRNMWGQFDCRAAVGFVTGDFLEGSGATMHSWPLRCGFARWPQGMSGAPLLARSGGGFVVLGLYASALPEVGTSAERGQVSLVAPIDRIASRLAAAMAAHPCRP
jgi:hypothetical protein